VTLPLARHFNAFIASGAFLGPPLAHLGRQWGPRRGPKVIKSRLRKGSQNRVGHQGRPRGSQGGLGGDLGSFFDGFWVDFGRVL